MFRLASPKTHCAHGILASDLYSEKKFYKAFIKNLKRSRQEVIIESPFMTVQRAQHLLPLFRRLCKRGVIIRIYTRHPKHHSPRLRHQGYAAAKLLKKNGVKVKFCKDLRHRKLGIIDNGILWEGSMNILSQSRSREIMRRTVSSDMCRQMVQFAGLGRRLW